MNKNNIHLKELEKNYRELYKNNSDIDFYFKELCSIMEKNTKERSQVLKEKDKKRPENWYLSNKLVGMMLYIDLFSGDIKELKERIYFFKELGIDYIHFMPILKKRKGKNDGGYAVQNYREIDEEYGTMKEFEELVYELSKEGISTCIDFVLNHTAKEHEWAENAKKGIKSYQDMYLMYDSDDIPNQYEATVEEVFPKVSPRNFTYYDDMKKWVFTSFYEFQWDLNFGNPHVFNMIIDNFLFIANRGVEIVRLDAIPFMWKKLGTNCRNLEEVHKLIKMIRIINKIVCSSVILKGEAIVQPEEIVKYFGDDKEKECQLMYNASFMVDLWSSLATRDVRLMRMSIQRSPKKSKDGAWINYVRCHDDIGWGFNEEISRELGWDPFLHKQFLINFYIGNHKDSFSKGEIYEFNPVNMDARNSGTLASLCGLEKAIYEKDEYQKELALKRIVLMQAMVIGYSGIPMLYSGDEIATINDYSYKEDKEKSLDTRWVHRSKFNWEDAEKRNDFGKVQGYVFQNIKKLISIRKEYDIFSSDTECITFYTGDESIFGYYKRKGNDVLVVLANFSEDRKYAKGYAMRNEYIADIKRDLVQGKKVDLRNENILLGPYEVLWLI